METNSFFSDLLEKYGLGKLVDDPILLPGGQLHESYKLSASTGNYAVKLINPSVLEDEYALKDFEKESKMEDLLAAAGVCAVYPISYNGSKMLEVNGRYFYLAYWFDGMPLSYDEVTEFHCKEVAEQLTRIHSIDFKRTENTSETLSIDFDNYIKRCKEASLPLADMLNDNLELLKKILSKGNQAAENVSMALSLCHNDYDLKNVLWNNDQYRIIDLEAVAYANPYQEIISSALSWSGADNFCFSEKLFDVYMNTYFSYSKIDLNVNWMDVFDSNLRRFKWLEFNLEKVLKNDIPQEERDAAIKAADKAIKRIVYFDQIRDTVLNNDKLKK